MAIKKLITDYKELRKSCRKVEKGEDISQIIQDLKDTLQSTKGRGLSANQIGYDVKVSYIKFPKGINKQTKEKEYTEHILINPETIEKSKKIKIQGEQCLSFPRLSIDTKRHIFIIIKNHNKNLKEDILMLQDWIAIAAQHEIDHLNGITILERKWRKR